MNFIPQVLTLNHLVFPVGPQQSPLFAGDRPGTGDQDGVFPTRPSARRIRPKDFQRMDQHRRRSMRQAARQVAHAERGRAEGHVEHEL